MRRTEPWPRAPSRSSGKTTTNLWKYYRRLARRKPRRANDIANSLGETPATHISPIGPISPSRGMTAARVHPCVPGTTPPSRTRTTTRSSTIHAAAAEPLTSHLSPLTSHFSLLTNHFSPSLLGGTNTANAPGRTPNRTGVVPIKTPSTCTCKRLRQKTSRRRLSNVSIFG